MNIRDHYIEFFTKQQPLVDREQYQQEAWRFLQDARGLWTAVTFGRGPTLDQTNADVVYSRLRRCDHTTWRSYTVGSRGHGYRAFWVRVHHPRGRGDELTAEESVTLGVDSGYRFTRAFQALVELMVSLESYGCLDDTTLSRRQNIIRLAAIYDNWPGVGDRPDGEKVTHRDNEPPPEDHWAWKVLAWLWDHDQPALELEGCQEGDVAFKVNTDVVAKACFALGILAGPEKKPRTVEGYELLYTTTGKGNTWGGGHPLCHECCALLPDEETKSEPFLEGSPFECEECSAEIVSAYGDPNEDNADAAAETESNDVV